MKRLLVFFLLIVFPSVLFAQGMQDTSGENTTSTPLTASIVSTENTGFLSTTDTIKKLQAKRLEIEATVSLEEDRVFEEVQLAKNIETLLADADMLMKELTTLMSQRDVLLLDNSLSLSSEFDIKIEEKKSLVSKKIRSLAEALEFGTYTNETTFPELQKDFSSLRKVAQNTLFSYEKTLSTLEKERQDFIIQKQVELREIDREIDRLQNVQRNQLWQGILLLGQYLGIFLFLYFLRQFSGKALAFFSSGFSKHHQEVMILIHRWAFNLFFVVALLILLSSEIASILPFLAVIGTAVGLALKDAIYSFIGWFVVGSSSGYAEGDFIEFDGTSGRVFRITPFITSMQSYGVQGFTGQMLTFPNKTIFEKTIKNWSRGSAFSLVSLDFLLTHNSNIQRAKEILMKIVGSRELPLYYSSRRNTIRTLKSTYGYTDADLKPVIHVLTTERGTLLRVRILMHVQDRLTEQSRIMEEFASQIQRAKDIELRQV